MPPAVLRQRIAAVQRTLADARVEALLVTNPRDILYLSGFIGDDSWALVRARSSSFYVLSDFRFQEQIQREAPHVQVLIRRKGLTDELAMLCGRLGLRTLALQQDHVTLSQQKAIRRKLRGVRLKPMDDRLLQQRAVKSSDEVRRITQALRIQEEAFTRTIRSIQPGQSEFQIAAKLEYEMRGLGADGPSFPTIVAADANASLPHAVPGSRKVRRGGIVLIDWGARYQGYCSDLTRVIAVGSMSRRMREVYQVVLDAQLAAIDAIAPGKLLKDIDTIARDLITKAGYGPQFGHSLGHGIGLDIHEQPTLAQRSEGVLEAGQVVTVEPGIYLPGIGGVRIEDDVLVTARGGRVLSDLPKSLDSAMILDS